MCHFHLFSLILIIFILLNVFFYGIVSDVMFWAFIDFSYSLLFFAIDMGVHLIIQSINSTKTNALLKFLK